MYPKHEAFTNIDTAARRIRADFPDFFSPRELAGQRNLTK